MNHYSVIILKVMFSLAEIFRECSQCGQPILHNLAFISVLLKILKVFFIFFICENKKKL